MMTTSGVDVIDRFGKPAPSVGQTGVETSSAGRTVDWQAVVRRCGYVREAVLQQSAIKDGVVIDRVVWATYRTQIARRAANIDAALAATAATAMERT